MTEWTCVGCDKKFSVGWRRILWGVLWDYEPECDPCCEQRKIADERLDKVKIELGKCIDCHAHYAPQFVENGDFEYIPPFIPAILDPRELDYRREIYSPLYFKFYTEGGMLCQVCYTGKVDYDNLCLRVFSKRLGRQVSFSQIKADGALMRDYIDWSILHKDTDIMRETLPF